MSAVGVCGFPRCGSSLTMRMLEAGGVSPIAGSSDGGYELAGGLERFARYRLPIDGRAVKLLDYFQWFDGLPDADWRFIWIDRDPMEQARSTRKFMQALVGVSPDPRRLAASYRRDRAELLRRMAAHGPIMHLRFESVLADPIAAAERLASHRPNFDVLAALSVVIDRSPACAPDLSIEVGSLGAAS